LCSALLWKMLCIGDDVIAGEDYWAVRGVTRCTVVPFRQ
jgi:hypothetical protein